MHLEWKPNICRGLVEDSRPFNLIVSTIWKPYKNVYHMHECVYVCVANISLHLLLLSSGANKLSN